MESFKERRLGKLQRNRKGDTLVKCVEYKNANNIKVKNLRSGDIYKSSWNTFINHNSNYAYASSSIQKKCRRVWSDMKRRCEDPKYKDRNKYYKDCTLCEEWQNYSNFARWFYRNYYEIDGEVVELDKDILLKGNKIYSAETCIFVPHRINTFFRHEKIKKNGLPKNVFKYDGYNSYLVFVGGERFGKYKTVDEAKKVADEKTSEIKNNLIKEYDGKIPENILEIIKLKFESEEN